MLGFRWKVSLDTFFFKPSPTPDITQVTKRSVLSQIAKRLPLIKLPSLKSRHKMLNAFFLLKLINGGINSQFLLEKLYIRAPVRKIRDYNFIYIE